MQNQKNNKFNFNKELRTIGIYIIGIVVICACFVKAIASWSETLSILKGFIRVIAPFLIGLFIAFVINPFVKVMDRKILMKILPDKKKLRLILAILCSYIVVIGLLVVTVFYLIPQITKSITDLAVAIQNFGPTIGKWLEQLQQRFPQLDLNSLDQTVAKAIPSLSSLLQNIVTKLVPGIYGLGRSIVSWLLNVLIAIMISCYMLIDKKRIYISAKRIIYAFLSKEKSENLIHTMRECSNIFTGFVVGKTIDSLIIGLLCFVIMSILGLQYTLIISIIVGVTNMIPYFGPFIGAVPGTFILVMVSPKSAIEFVIMIIILQQFDGLFLGPKILGDSTGLRPLWIIFAITVGGWVAGPVGMFLGVPVVAVIAYLVEKAIDVKLAKKGIVMPVDESNTDNHNNIEETQKTDGKQEKIQANVKEEVTESKNQKGEEDSLL